MPASAAIAITTTSEKPVTVALFVTDTKQTGLNQIFIQSSPVTQDKPGKITQPAALALATRPADASKDTSTVDVEKGQFWIVRPGASEKGAPVLTFKGTNITDSIVCVNLATENVAVDLQFGEQVGLSNASVPNNTETIFSTDSFAYKLVAVDKSTKVGDPVLSDAVKSNSVEIKWGMTVTVTVTGNEETGYKLATVP